jgi:hypothetical protein
MSRGPNPREIILSDWDVYGATSKSLNHWYMYVEMYAIIGADAR